MRSTAYPDRACTCENNASFPKDPIYLRQAPSAALLLAIGLFLRGRQVEKVEAVPVTSLAIALLDR